MLLELQNPGSQLQQSATVRQYTSDIKLRQIPQKGVIVWSLCLFSFVSLELNQRFGTVAIVAFLASWIVIIIPRHSQFIAAVVRNWAILLLPGFAILSILWSRDPSWSLRTSIEYLITILIGIAAASCVNRRTLLSSVLVTLAVVNGIGVGYALYRGHFNFQETGRGVTGLFGSKNWLAGESGLQMIIAFSLLVFEKKSNLIKLIYIIILASGAIGFYLGKSSGALMALILASLIISLIVFSRRSWLIVAFIIIGGLFLGLAVLSEFSVDELSSIVLSSLGKEKTLTGRTDLWKVALDQINEASLTGVGYSAFWRPGNPNAEPLWAEFGIIDRAGFQFHNTYLQICVDLGLVGGALFAATFIFAVWRSVRECFHSMSPQKISLAGMMLFLFIWSFVEVQFIGPFLLSTIVLTISSCHMRMGNDAVE